MILIEFKKFIKITFEVKNAILKNCHMKHNNNDLLISFDSAV